jgi:hypothetical protein
MKNWRQNYLFYTIAILCIIVFLVSCSNSIANSRWQAVEGEATLSFGRTSYSYTYSLILFEFSVSGSYTKSGDVIIFTDNDGNESRGVLIGDTITVFGRRFRRIK